MNISEVLMVRIYIAESSNSLKKIADYLKHEAKVRGITVFRAIEGFGETGAHTAGFLDLSLDLPLVIEFFDEDKVKVEKALTHLNTLVKAKHIVMWNARVNI